MAQVKRFDPTVGGTPSRAPRGGQVKEFATLAEKLQNFSTQFNAEADAIAQQEGSRAGAAAAAGRVGGVDIPEDMTVRDQAFAKSARAAHAAAIQTDIRSKVAELETAHQFDIEGFNIQLDAYRDGLFQEIDDDLKPIAIQELGDYKLRSQVRIEKNIFDQSMNENLATINTAIDGMQEDALTAAYQGDEAQLMNKQAQYFQLMDVGVENNLFTRDQAEKAKRQFNDNVDYQNVVGVFERTIEEEGLEAAETAFSNFRKQKGIEPGLRQKITNKMQAEINRARAKERAERTREKAEITAREKALKRTVDNAEFSLNNGYQVEGLAELIEVSRGTKYEKELLLMQKHQDAVNEFTQLSPAEMDQTLAQIQAKDGHGGEEIRLIERLKKTRDHIRTELNGGRGLDLALKQDIIEELPPINDMQGRAEAARIASEHYGQPIPAMTDAEIDEFKANLDGASTDQKIAQFGQLVDGLGEDSLPLLESLAGKNSGMYAVAGSLMVEGRGSVGREMIKGLDAREAYPKIIPSDFDQKFEGVIKSAYARTPKQVEVLRDAMKTLYAQRAMTKGEYTGQVTDDGLLEEAFNEVTGGVYTLQDQGSGAFFDDRYDIEAPAPGVNQDDFIDWMENITQAEVESMGGGSVSTELTKAINDMSVKLITLGDGRYQVIRNGLPVVTDELKPFILAWPK